MAGRGWRDLGVTGRGWRGGGVAGAALTSWYSSGRGGIYFTELCHLVMCTGFCCCLIVVVCFVFRVVLGFEWRDMLDDFSSSFWGLFKYLLCTDKRTKHE